LNREVTLTTIMATNHSSSPPLKRKRDAVSKDELEINLSLPEPLSKKALRKAKKTRTQSSNEEEPRALNQNDAKPTDPEKDEDSTSKTPKPRSEWGIWIGNLPWTTTKSDLRQFFCKDTSIEEADITRVHMPAPSTPKDARPIHPTNQPKNRGFAYVDFAHATAQRVALRLSETLLLGRRVLIKDAVSFEGRPDPADKDSTVASKGMQKPPSKRIFVGNLGFDVEKTDLERHFAKCGEVVDVHMATFEDSGKCKGFAWITFVSEEASTAAVRGWIEHNVDEDDAENEPDEEQAEDDGADPSRKTNQSSKKTKRHYVNKINGRKLRCEFAEDPSVRYRKRFGKGPKSSTGENGEQTEPDMNDSRAAPSDPSSSAHDRRRVLRKVTKGAQRGYKPSPTTMRLAQVTGAIVQGTGQKVTFD
jgi:RNA recognition motif-containing protein